MVDRSYEMIASLFGILKTGNYYIPLDPHIPKERTQYILAQMTPPLAITLKKYEEFFSGFKGKLIFLDEDPLYFKKDTSLHKRCNNPEDIAYVMFTSGSTGVPKGIKVKHYQLLNSLWWHIEFVGFSEKTRMLQTAVLTFDASVVEIFCTLLSGGKLFLIGQEENKFP